MNGASEVLLGTAVGARDDGAHDAHARRCTTWRDRARLDVAMVGNCNLAIYQLRPVRREQQERLDTQGLGDAEVGTDGCVRVATLDALDLSVAHAGCGSQLFLAEVSPLADAGDVPADAPELCNRLRGEWIFGHTATLEVRGLRDHAKPGAFMDLAQILIDGHATDSVERMSDLAAFRTFG